MRLIVGKVTLRDVIAAALCGSLSVFAIFAAAAAAGKSAA